MQTSSGHALEARRVGCHPRPYSASPSVLQFVPRRRSTRCRSKRSSQGGSKSATLEADKRLLRKQVRLGPGQGRSREASGQRLASICSVAGQCRSMICLPDPRQLAYALKIVGPAQEGDRESFREEGLRHSSAPVRVIFRRCSLQSSSLTKSSTTFVRQSIRLIRCHLRCFGHRPEGDSR